MQNQYSELIDNIVKQNIATLEEVKEVQFSSIKTKSNFPRQLVAEGVVASHQLLRLMYSISNFPTIDLREFLLSQEVIKKTDEAMVRKHNMVPVFERGGRLFVVTFDPLNNIGIDSFKFSGSYGSAEPIIASVEQVEQLIEDVYAGRKDMDDLFSADEEQDEASKAEELERLSKELLGQNTDADEAPVVRYVSGMLLDAIRTGASDLHFEPYEHN